MTGDTVGFAGLGGWMWATGGLLRDHLIAALAVIGTLLVLELRRRGTSALHARQRAEDRVRLRESLRRAQQNGDTQEETRCRRVGQELRRRAAWDSKWSLLAALGVTVGLAGWGQRLWGWQSLTSGQPTSLVLRVATGAGPGEAYALPAEGVSWLDDPVQRLQQVEGGWQARWRLRLRDESSAGVLRLRFGRRELRHRVAWVSPGLLPLQQPHGEGVETQLEAEPYRPLGRIPARLPGGIPGWVVWWGLWSLITWWVWQGLRRRGQRVDGGGG